MVYLLRFTAFIAIIVLSACCQERAPTDAAPKALLTEGKYTVINYWAEWCKPCREEIPELNDLAQVYKDQATVYAINFDGVSGEALSTLAATFGIKYDSITIEDGKGLGIDRPAALPTTVVLRSDGTIKATLLGPQTVQSLASYFQ